MFGVNLDDIDIDGKDPNGNYPEVERYGANNYPDTRDSREIEFYENYTSERYTPRVAARSTSFAAAYGGYKYQFNTEEELITSPVFQRCLGQALAHKDREIASLRNELLKPYWARD